MGMLMRRHTGGEATTSGDVTPKRRRKAKDEPAKSEPKAKDADKAE